MKNDSGKSGIQKILLSQDLFTVYANLIHRYNDKIDKLEPSVTVFHKSELNRLGTIVRFILYKEKLLALFRIVFYLTRKAANVDIKNIQTGKMARKQGRHCDLQ